VPRLFRPSEPRARWGGCWPAAGRGAAVPPPHPAAEGRGACISAAGGRGAAWGISAAAAYIPGTLGVFFLSPFRLRKEKNASDD